MATELAKAYVQIVPSAKGIKSGIEQALGGDGSSAGQSFGANLLNRLKGLIAAAGIGKALAAAVNEGAALEQNLGGTEAVFGDFASSIQASATNAYKNMGLSASDYMATANKMGSLFQGSGLEQQRSLELTSQAMQRAADVASVMGIDMDMAMESIAGAAKGNFTMMDNLGVAMNATTLEAYALEKGVNFKWNTATNAEKSELAMQMFFDRTSQYAGNFAKESETTISGSLEAIKAAFKNVLGQITLGQDIKPALNALAQTMTTFLVGNLLPAVWNILRALPGALVTFIQAAIPQLVSAIMEFLPQLQTGVTMGLPQVFQQGGAILSQIISGVAAGLPQVFQMALKIITSFVSTFIANIPQYLQTGTEVLMSLIAGIRQALPQMLAAAAEAILSMVTGIARNLPQILSAGFGMIASLIRGIGNAMPDIASAAARVAKNLLNTILETDWLQLGKDIIQGMIDGIGTMAGALWDAAVNIAKSAFDAICTFFGIKSPSRLMRDEVGKFIPAGIAVGIQDNTGPVKRAMKEITDLATGTVQGDVAMGLRYDLPKGAPALAYAGGYGGTTNFYQTINTHEALSPAEMTREAENLFARRRWKNP